MKDNIDNYNKGRNRAKGRVRFESGGFKFEGNQKEGRPIGAWKIVSGACVLAEFEFDKNGVLNGAFVIRHANGKLAFKGVFSQNQIHGECSEFYLNGNVKAIYNFQNGKLSGLQKDFYTNGVAHSNFSIDGESGRLNGMYELYYFDGGVWCKGQFENDLKKGNWIFNIHLNSFWQGILMRYPEVETMESSVVVAEETDEEKLPQLILDRLKKGNTLGLSVFYKIEDNRSVLTSPVITN